MSGFYFAKTGSIDLLEYCGSHFCSKLLRAAKVAEKHYHQNNRKEYVPATFAARKLHTKMASAIIDQFAVVFVVGVRKFCGPETSTTANPNNSEPSSDNNWQGQN